MLRNNFCHMLNLRFYCMFCNYHRKILLVHFCPHPNLAIAIPVKLFPHKSIILRL